MDRSKLLALFRLHRASAISALVPQGAAPSPEAVYEAARDMRRRIEAALAASRVDTPPSGPRG